MALAIRMIAVHNNYRNYIELQRKQMYNSTFAFLCQTNKTKPNSNAFVQIQSKYLLALRQQMVFFCLDLFFSRLFILALDENEPKTISND